MGPEYKLGAWHAVQSSCSLTGAREIPLDAFPQIFPPYFSERIEHSSLKTATLSGICETVLQRLKPKSSLGVAVAAEAATYKEPYKNFPRSGRQRKHGHF
jgi:hypothetical protein